MTASQVEEKPAPAVAAAAQEAKAEKRPDTSAQKPRVAPAKAKAGKKATSGKKRPKAANIGKSAKSPKREVKAGAEAGAARVGSKTAKVVELLRRPDGATLQQIVRATLWQPHSVRGFISGTLGKKMGLAVVSTKREDGERVYSIPQ